LPRPKKNINSKLLKFSYEIIKDVGFSAFIELVKEERKMGKNSIFNSVTSGKLNVKIIDLPDYKKNSTLLPVKASIIIPTNSNKEKLQSVLDSIKNQKGISDIEIILVNSGLQKLTELGDSKTKIFNVKPSEFQHGRTRNFGATKATGKYLVFMVDDAKLTNDTVLYKMIKILEDDSSIKVITGRQFQTADSDMMYSINMKTQYDNLQLKKDRILWAENFEGLNTSEKLQASHLDDVFSCYDQSFFMNNQYSEINYGEDLDLGMRLAKQGTKIAQLYSEGVYHSHSRPADYYLKRHYVSTFFLKKLLESNFPLRIFKTQSFNLISCHVLQLYSALCLALDYVLKQNNESIEINAGFKLLKNKMKNYYGSKNHPENIDSSLDDLFKIIFKNCKREKVGKYKNNVLIKYFLFSLFNLEYSIKEQYPDMHNMNTQILNTIHKKFAQVIGTNLAHFSYIKINDEKEIMSLHEFLIKGI